MDSATITVIGAVAVTIIAAIAAAAVAIINALRSVQEKQEVNSAQITTIAKDAEAIKGHVNSEKTAANGRENLLQAENKLLREMITDKTSTASLLAQAVAQRARTNGHEPDPEAAKT